jgi:hypothetical protein
MSQRPFLDVDMVLEFADGAALLRASRARSSVESPLQNVFNRSLPDASKRPDLVSEALTRMRDVCGLLCSNLESMMSSSSSQAAAAKMRAEWSSRVRRAPDAPQSVWAIRGQLSSEQASLHRWCGVRFGGLNAECNRAVLGAVRVCDRSLSLLKSRDDELGRLVTRSLVCCEEEERRLSSAISSLQESVMSTTDRLCREKCDEAESLSLRRMNANRPAPSRSLRAVLDSLPSAVEEWDAMLELATDHMKTEEEREELIVYRQYLRSMRDAESIALRARRRIEGIVRESAAAELRERVRALCESSRARLDDGCMSPLSSALRACQAFESESTAVCAAYRKEGRLLRSGLLMACEQCDALMEADSADPSLLDVRSRVRNLADQCQLACQCAAELVWECRGCLAFVGSEVGAARTVKK